MNNKKSTKISHQRRKAKKDQFDNIEDPLDLEQIKLALKKEFPQGGDQAYHDKQGRLTKYRLNSQLLLQENCAYKNESYDMLFLSPRDNLCFLHSLAHLAREENWPEYNTRLGVINEYPTKDFFDGYTKEEIGSTTLDYAYTYAQAISTQCKLTQMQGHTIEQMQIICNQLSIGLSTIREFVDMVNEIKSKNIQYKDVEDSDGTIKSLLPRILIVDNHACVVMKYSERSKRYFTTADLAMAFKDPQSPKTIVQKFVNNDTAKYIKLQHKLQKAQHQQQSSSQSKSNKNPRHKFGQEESSQQSDSEIMYNVRRQLKKTIANLRYNKDLPETSDQDGFVAEYVLKYQLGLCVSNQVPVPMSKTSLLYLSSLQKAKHPECFKYKEKIQIKSFTVNPNLLSNQIIGARDTEEYRENFEIESQEPLELKEVQSTAVENLSPDLIVSCYINQNPKPSTKQDKEKDFTAIEVFNKRWNRKKEKFWIQQPVVTPQGILSNDFKHICSIHGLSLSNDQIIKSAHTSGGHPCMRTLINLLISDQILRVSNHVIESKSSTVVIVCPGDKFVKTVKWLDTIFTWQASDLYVKPVEGTEKDHEKKYQDALGIYEANIKLFNQHVADTKQHFKNNMQLEPLNESYLQRTQYFRQLHKTNAQLYSPDRWEQLNKLPYIHHRSIRPNEEDYDKTYYREGLGKVDIDPYDDWSPGRPYHEIIQGIIQENDTQYLDKDVIY